MKKIIVVFLMFIVALSLCLAACNPQDDEFDTSKYEIDMDIGENLGNFDDYELPREDGTRQLIIYWRENKHSYVDKDVWLWHDFDSGRAYEFHPCAYGAKAVINVADNIDEVGFILRKNATTHTDVWGSADKVYPYDSHIKRRYGNLSHRRKSLSICQLGRRQNTSDGKTD